MVLLTNNPYLYTENKTSSVSQDLSTSDFRSLILEIRKPSQSGFITYKASIRLQAGKIKITE